MMKQIGPYMIDHLSTSSTLTSTAKASNICIAKKEKEREHGRCGGVANGTKAFSQVVCQLEPWSLEERVNLQQQQ